MKTLKVQVPKEAVDAVLEAENLALKKENAKLIKENEKLKDQNKQLIAANLSKEELNKVENLMVQLGNLLGIQFYRDDD